MNRVVHSVAVLVVAAVVLFGVAGRAAAGEHPFVGSAKCKLCHLQEWKSWSETKMAQAFDALRPGRRAERKTAVGLDPDKDYTKDGTCVPCHVTGYGKEGGFTSIEATPDLAGVGCEACHGAGKTYLQKEYMSLQNKSYKKAELVAVGLNDRITVEQCQGCHNSKSPFVGPDYVFDFEARKTQGTHVKVPLKFQH